MYSVDENTIANGNYKTYITDYRARIPTNESIESNHSNKNKQQQQQHNIHNRLYTDNNTFINNNNMYKQNTHNNNYRTVRSDKQLINADNVSIHIYINTFFKNCQ